MKISLPQSASSLPIILGGLLFASAVHGQTEYTLDGSPTPLEEEIRWHVNRGRFDSARENQLRKTSFTDIPARSGPLAPHQSLTLAARHHSEDMARNNVMQHDTVPGSLYYDAATQPTPWDRFRAEGYNFNGAGENIAAGYSSATAAHVGWWKSNGHRVNMFDAGLREIGNGYFHWASSTYKHYYTMNLGSMGNNQFFTDTVFHDANSDRTYNQGEGVAGIKLQLRLPAADHPSFDISNSSGSFAIPISGIAAGTRVEVWLMNTTATATNLTIPRDFDTHSTLTLTPGSWMMAGTFMKPSANRNFGFRDLGIAASPDATQLIISRDGHETKLRWTSRAGMHYRPQFSTDLSLWTDLTPAPLDGTGNELTHRHVSSAARGFYRVAYEPAP